MTPPSIQFELHREGIAARMALNPIDVWSPDEVLIDGRRYKIEGPPSLAAWLREQIPQFFSHDNISRGRLKEILTCTVHAHDVRIVKKTHHVAQRIVGSNEGDVVLLHRALEEKTNARIALQKAKADPALILQAKKEEMDAFLHYVEAKEHFRGVVLVRQGSSNDLLRAPYGPSREGQPNTLDTRYAIGSVGKMLTASAIMLLEQEGKLDLNQEINSYLPKEFQHELWKGITVLHLLTHTSGLPCHGSFPEDEMRSRPFTAEDILALNLILLFTEKKDLKPKDKVNDHLPKQYRRKEWENITALELWTHEINREDKRGDERYRQVDALHQFVTKNLEKIGGGLLFKPGQKWAYANFGYVLLGQIIKSLRGSASYEEYMNSLFHRLGMENTGFNYDENEDARGFMENGSQALVYAEKMSIHASKANAAGGSMFSTIGDMEKFARALHEDTFLRQETRRKMITAPFPQLEPHQGLGCVFGDVGPSMMGHPGAILGFNSSFEYNIETQDLFILLGNADLSLFHAALISMHLQSILYS